MKTFFLSRFLFLLTVWLLATSARAAEPVFIARTASGKVVRGPLHKLAADWSVEIGKSVRHKIIGEELLCLRREGTTLPPLPSAEHLILANGDRLPVQDLRLDDEKLYFRHKDLGDKEVSLPLSAVVLIWRMAPDRVVSAERFRRLLTTGKRSHDRVLLRNGDALEGTLNGLGAGNVEIEVNKKTVTTRWPQVAVVALSTELTDRLRLKGVHARIILAATDGSPGGRLTLTSATCDGDVLRGKTAFGAVLRVPLERVLGLEIYGGKAIYLSDLEPSKYEYRPYLDEKWAWSIGGNVLGRDLRVGGSTHDRGIGMHAHSLLSYSLGGAYRRFEAKVGLDDRDGRKGRVRVRVLVDGKAADLGKKTVLTHGDGPLVVRVDVTGAKLLTLEIDNAEDGPVQGVVDWVNARLVR